MISPEIEALFSERGKLHAKIIRDIYDLPRDAALNVVLSYISIEGLQKIAGVNPDVEPEVDHEA